MVSYKPLKVSEIYEVTELMGDIFPNSWSFESLHAFIRNTSSASLGLYCKSDLCGFILISTVLEEAEIFSFAIRQINRHQGYGGRLLDKALNILRKKGILKVFLEVSENNSKAQALYKSRQFEKIGVRKNYYKEGAGSYSDAITMVHCLQQESSYKV